MFHYFHFQISARITINRHYFRSSHGYIYFLSWALIHSHWFDWVSQNCLHKTRLTTPNFYWPITSKLFYPQTNTSRIWSGVLHEDR